MTDHLTAWLSRPISLAISSEVTDGLRATHFAGRIRQIAGRVPSSSPLARLASWLFELALPNEPQKLADDVEAGVLH